MLPFFNSVLQEVLYLISEVNSPSAAKMEFKSED
jgi:hypothetical protein